jgi:hypothetical protein
MLNILQRITLYAQEWHRYPSINFTKPLSDSEKDIKNVYHNFQNAFHRFSPSITNMALWEEVLDHREELYEMCPEVIEFVKLTVQTWASNPIIKTKEDIKPRFEKLKDLLSTLIILLNKEVDRQYNVDSDKYKQSLEEFKKL